METITIEKVIKFNNVIDSLESIDVTNNLKYQLYDDASHASAIIDVIGVVKTVMDTQNFEENVEVEIFTPYDKVIDKDSFNVVVKDYSYVINNSNLNIYLILEINGIVDKNNNEEAIEANYNEIVHSMNELNAINTNEEENRNEIVKEKTVEDNEIVKDKEIEDNKNVKKQNTQNEDVFKNNTWANNLFKLKEGYSVFKVYHIY